MSVYNFIDINFLNPLKSVPVQWYYTFRKKYNALNTSKRDHHIVVSLTSFPDRFKTLHFALKSILTQTMMPDIIFLCLTKEEVENESELPLSISELKKYGIQIYFADNNLKPHNKYIYAMRMYPDSLIITVDDDNMYDKNLIANLYKSYIIYPKAVSARRVHKINYDNDNNILPYTKWHYEYRKELNPSEGLLATGVGGVLYPPKILPPETFDEKKIRDLCLNADDIWLKFMEQMAKVPVVWAAENNTMQRRVHPLNIKKAQKITLQKNNYHGSLNDKYISDLQNYYGFTLGK